MKANFLASYRLLCHLCTPNSGPIIKAAYERHKRIFLTYFNTAI